MCFLWLRLGQQLTIALQLNGFLTRLHENLSCLFHSCTASLNQKTCSCVTETKQGKLNGLRHSRCPTCCYCCQIVFPFAGDAEGVTAGPVVHLSAGSQSGERLTNVIRGLVSSNITAHSLLTPQLMHHSVLCRFKSIGPRISCTWWWWMTNERKQPDMCFSAVLQSGLIRGLIPIYHVLREKQATWLHTKLNRNALNGSRNNVLLEHIHFPMFC